MPIHALILMEALIPKKDASKRAIAIAPSTSRMLMGMLAPQLREWDATSALGGDMAAPGKDMRKETVYKLALQEAEVINGKCAAQILWDISGFYDELKDDGSHCPAAFGLQRGGFRNACEFWPIHCSRLLLVDLACARRSAEDWQGFARRFQGRTLKHRQTCAAAAW